MNSLKAIQTIAKVARILSKIIYICCIVGACGCVVGIISLSLGAGALKFGGVTFESLIKNNSGYSKSTMYLVMTIGIIFSVGEGVLSKFANVYFRLKRVEHRTVSLAAFIHAALRLLPVGVSLTGNLTLRCLKNSSAETLRP